MLFHRSKELSMSYDKIFEDMKTLGYFYDNYISDSYRFLDVQKVLDEFIKSQNLTKPIYNILKNVIYI